jgi:hypothetical protein
MFVVVVVAAAVVLRMIRRGREERGLIWMMCTTGQVIVDPRLLRQREMADIATLCAGSFRKGDPPSLAANSPVEPVVARAAATDLPGVGAQGSAVSQLTFMP